VSDNKSRPPDPQQTLPRGPQKNIPTCLTANLVPAAQ